MLMALRLSLASGCEIIATFFGTLFGVVLACPEDKFGTIAFDLLHVRFVFAIAFYAEGLIAIGNALVTLAEQRTIFSLAVA